MIIYLTINIFFKNNIVHNHVLYHVRQNNEKWCYATIRISTIFQMTMEGTLHLIQFIFQQSLLSSQMNQDHPFMKAKILIICAK